jgi:hypothetical protein
MVRALVGGPEFTTTKKVKYTFYCKHSFKDRSSSPTQVSGFKKLKKFWLFLFSF